LKAKDAAFTTMKSTSNIQGKSGALGKRSRGGKKKKPDDSDDNDAWKTIAEAAAIAVIAITIVAGVA